MASYSSINNVEANLGIILYLKVKLVPRLGPFAVSSTSKNVMASVAEKNVIDNRPP